MPGSCANSEVRQDQFMYLKSARLTVAEPREQQSLLYLYLTPDCTYINGTYHQPYISTALIIFLPTITIINYNI